MKYSNTLNNIAFKGLNMKLVMSIVKNLKNDSKDCKLLVL